MGLKLAAGTGPFSFWVEHTRSRFLAYSIAVICPLATLFVVLGLQRGGHVVPLYPFFTLTIILSALVGGLFPGLVALGSSLLYIYIAIWPHYVAVVGQRSALLSFLAFALVGGSISVVIGALRSSQTSLFESNLRYRSLFESIDEGFCTIEMLFDERGTPNDWRYVEANPAFKKQMDIAFDPCGKTARDVNPHLEPQWLDMLGRVAITGEPTRYVKESVGRWFEGYAFRVGEPEQHRVAFLFTDITERKRSEEALIRNEKLAAAGRLAATIAHEVNNPLEAATNALYIVSFDPTLKPETKKYVTLADEELRRAAHMTRQTLGFYRESGSRTSVALPKLIDEVLAVYAGKLQSRNVSVRRRYTCGRCGEGCEGCFLVNAGEMRQIISNLLANGIDAISNGGTMDIRVSRLSHPSTGESQIQLTMADNGTGIRAENLKRIFEPFYTTKQDVGTGLGLWVTHELVRKHKGCIKVRSKSGKGTVFRITFPAMPNSFAAKTESVSGTLVV